MKILQRTCKGVYDYLHTRFQVRSSIASWGIIINLKAEHNFSAFSMLYWHYEYAYFSKIYEYAGTVVAQWLRCCATNRKVAGSIPAGVSGFFIDIKSFWSHYGPEVNPASNWNEHQENFLGVKWQVRKSDNLPPSCAVVTKSENLNFLRTLWSCPGL